VPYAPPDGDVTAVARALLGARLTTSVGGVPTAIVINEVEAYGGTDDPASHAYRGRTGRNASMFGPAGTLYVYRIYGMHWCANVVAGPAEVPGAVLVRGGIPVSGHAVMTARRGREDHLTDGPGKVCAALAITGNEDGTSLIAGPVRLETPVRRPDLRIEATPRIGISVATDLPWRFVAHRNDVSSLADT
jgi:DNA-3-methyladenine glycosylase